MISSFTCWSLAKQLKLKEQCLCPDKDRVNARGGKGCGEMEQGTGTIGPISHPRSGRLVAWAKTPRNRGSTPPIRSFRLLFMAVREAPASNTPIFIQITIKPCGEGTLTETIVLRDKSWTSAFWYTTLGQCFEIYRVTSVWVSVGSSLLLNSVAIWIICSPSAIHFAWLYTNICGCKAKRSKPCFHFRSRRLAIQVFSFNAVLWTSVFLNLHFWMKK